MKLTPFLLMFCVIGLASGCASPGGDFCDIADPIYFGRDDVVDWLSANDEPLLRGIVTHNSLVETCR